ncbi:enoyl-CoA hydratase-related protein [Bosea sp. (in: a-proteobacteria)]|uniref:enoyl-CoA hydratase/isomerase family protein n=1 Tax=Bosea sp. (in: a-proteobacteria) TaxID=1871050 RepID=UPI0026372FEB|nr:enoyl-CoA hydratase-related protein [Bosea sp. (in: a-proteobacteria)]MCO5090739.1 enoyl-CoA hydratase-related protein [Bosea sp. (in: a-proteobacteria)]
MHRELADIFVDINRDPETKVVVLTGAGDRIFCAGGEFSAMQESIENPQAAVVSMQEGIKLVHALLAVDKPTIARINGHAIGFGATLALFCDLTYAVDTAKIGDPHVLVGYAAGDGGALIWPQLIGYARAREFLLTGDSMRGAEAAAMGLVTRAVKADALDDTVNATAKRLAEGATVAINATKQAINMPLRRQFSALIEAHIGLELMSHFSNDHVEAVAAMLEKRAPVFSGT